MFGINPSEFIVLLVVAAVVLGPERLPEYAQQLTRLIRELRRMAQGASAQVREELGPEFDDIDWRKLDPRQYDPRRIVRDALSDVWDPDDPLGMGSDPLGLRTATDTHVGIPDDPPGYSNPVRYGAGHGPAEAKPPDGTWSDSESDLDGSSDSGDSGEAGDVSAQKPQSAGGPQPVGGSVAYDPDAT